MSERLTWEEIQEQYPDQWVGLVDVKYVDDEEILVNALGGKLVKENVPFTGFGGIAYGNLYQVTIEVGDLIFPNMHIVANNELDTSYNLILSATMFQNLICCAI